MTCIMHGYFREYTEYTPIFLCNPSIIPEICYPFYCKNPEYCSVFTYSEYFWCQRRRHSRTSRTALSNYYPYWAIFSTVMKKPEVVTHWLIFDASTVFYPLGPVPPKVCLCFLTQVLLIIRTPWWVSLQFLSGQIPSVTCWYSCPWQVLFSLPTYLRRHNLQQMSVQASVYFCHVSSMPWFCPMLLSSPFLLPGHWATAQQMLSFLSK